MRKRSRATCCAEACCSHLRPFEHADLRALLRVSACRFSTDGQVLMELVRFDEDVVALLEGEAKSFVRREP